MKNRLEDTKREKVKLHCNPKTHQSTLQNPMAKKYKHFTQQTRIPPKN